MTSALLNLSLVMISVGCMAFVLWLIGWLFDLGPELLLHALRPIAAVYRWWRDLPCGGQRDAQ